MAIASEEVRQIAPRILSAANKLSTIGIVDNDISTNSTVTALTTAILNLGNAAAWKTGGHPDTLNNIVKALKLGVTLGIISETHGASTVAGFAALISSQIPEVRSDYAAALLQ
jgi:hypothetical protein